MAALQAPVKLVVWDLDETFWHGTLSEEGIRYQPAHHDLVIALARRGIVSSVCSKNDLGAARRELEAHGIWRYFVFPRIDWRPKGPMLRELLDAAQLRAENVLFVDDNPMNLHQAEHFCAGLQTASPEALATLLDDAALRGKPDPELRRLKHYEVLMAKAADAADLELDHDDFLRRAQIRVQLVADVGAHRDRVLELIERTNQLNFTKRRSSGAELDALLADPEVDASCVHAIDRYGDYGICGFYAVRGGEVLHFLFSCRVLHMGIERWLHARLGAPAVPVQGEVAVELGDGAAVDWIVEARLDQPQVTVQGGTARYSVLLKGGCDLDQVVHFFRAPRTVQTEFNYVGPDQHSIRTDHLEILRRHDMDIAGRYAEVLRRTPFLDVNAFRTAAFDGDHEVVIYSVLMDYNQGLYRHRDGELVLPYGDLLVDVTAPENRAAVEAAKPYPAGFLDWFAEQFEFTGATSAERFTDNLRWLRSQLAEHQLLVLVNGAEIDMAGPIGATRGRHHAAMNAVLEASVAQLPRTVVCDVRRFVRTPADLVDNVRHYRRQAYFKLATELERLVSEHTGAPALRPSRLRGALRRALRRIARG